MAAQELKVVETEPADERWSAHLSQYGPVDFHQGPSWFGHLKHFDRDVRALLVLRDGVPAASALVSADENGWKCWRGPVGRPDRRVLERVIQELRPSRSVMLAANTGWDLVAERMVDQLRHDGSYTTNLLSLCCDDEEMLARMTPTARNRTRRAARLGVTVRVGAEVIDEFFDLYEYEMRRVRSPDVASREEMADLCLERGAVLLTAWHGGQLAAGAVALDFDGVLEMRYVATSHDARSASPMNLVYFEAMRWGRTHGRAWLDVSGIATGEYLNDRGRALNHFKMGFGYNEQRTSNYYRAPRARQDQDLPEFAVGLR